MLWSGLIKINKIIKLDDLYQLYIDLTKSVDSFKNIEINNKINNEINNEAIITVKLNPLMLCNYYDQFKIKTTKKFIDIDFSNSNVFIKLDINDDNTIHVKTMTKTETQIQIQIQSQSHTKKREYKITNKSIRKSFTTELIDICKKINN